ncbi:MAG: DNRLRE domain-containing protein [Dehalococcoidales bacterium]|nr:DNRLRE domain-containing protein [Dehalococcoidales bacterium]
MFIYLAIFDRRLWYDTTPSSEDLANWDAVGVYLDLDGNVGTAPGANAHRFVVMLNSSEEQPLQTAYRGDSGKWVSAATPFTSRTGWRGNALNDDVDDRGWTANFYIPFESLGLSSEPPVGAVWGMGVSLHDRDDAGGTPIPDQHWPENLDSGRPVTWGQLAFGLPTYTPPPSIPRETIAIRRGLNAMAVPDADVGGTVATGTCAWWGEDTWTYWGEINYGHSDQVNVQNQGDVADWACLAKYYVTFPLDAVPPGKVIISATLTMHQFGNAGQCEPGPNCEPQPPQPSWIQVLVPDQDWDEDEITWNNAPLAAENIGGAWVEPVDSWPGGPGIPWTWDVSRAVAEAYGAGRPASLILYSADWDYHSGKYFVSSDTDDWNETGRPTLQVQWGDSVAE